MTSKRAQATLNRNQSHGFERFLYRPRHSRHLAQAGGVGKLLAQNQLEEVRGWAEKVEDPVDRLGQGALI